MIAAVGVTKRYGARLALDAVSFTASDGSITASSDRMARGRRPAFRIASGLMKADAGGIEIGQNGTGDQTLGVLAHVHGLYGRLTVREHISVFRRTTRHAGGQP